MTTVVPIVMSERDLKDLAGILGLSEKTETEFNGYKILVEKLGETYDYEIFIQDPCFFRWHVWHTDTDFETEEQALEEAKNYIHNYEPKVERFF